MSSNHTYSVFSKAWHALSIPELGAALKDLGFNGVELALRPGFHGLGPENTDKLPEAARGLEEFGVKIRAVAGPLDEPTIAACGEAGIPFVRICAEVCNNGSNFFDDVTEHQKHWDSLLPSLESAGVAILVQNHFSPSLANAAELLFALQKYDPRHVCAAWDAGHSGLEGSRVPQELDIIASHMRVLVLKSAFYNRVSAADDPVAEWGLSWTTGRQGRAEWPWVAEELKKRGFAGDIFLSAEYDDFDAAPTLVREDIEWAKELFA